MRKFLKYIKTFQKLNVAIKTAFDHANADLIVFHVNSRRTKKLMAAIGAVQGAVQFPEVVNA